MKLQKNQPCVISKRFYTLNNVVGKGSLSYMYNVAVIQWITSIILFLAVNAYLTQIKVYIVCSEKYCIFFSLVTNEIYEIRRSSFHKFHMK